MSALPSPERHVGTSAFPDQPDLPLAAEGVLRVVWHSRFGDILIEVRDGQIFVNGDAVVPADASSMSALSCARVVAID